MRYDVRAAGQRIKALREARGWSQRQLARRTGATGRAVSHTSLAQMEKGATQRLALELVESLARALGVALTDLLVAEAEAEAPPGAAGAAAFDSGRPGVSDGGAAALASSVGEARSGAAPAGVATAAQPSQGSGPVGWAAPVGVYRGYALGSRDDPRDRTGRADALGTSRRRMLAVDARTTDAIGAPEGDAFALIVTSSSLAHVATEAGPIGPGWTLYVNADDPALRAEPDRVVVAMAHGELVAGFLERDDGLLIVDAHRRHPITPGDVLGTVVWCVPPGQGLTWRADPPAPGGPPVPTGPAYLGTATTGRLARP